MALRSFAVSGAIAVLASIAVGIELHAGHQATHATALWRRLGNHRSLRFHRSGRHTDAGKEIQVEIGVHTERVKNITTVLQDQKTEYIGMIGVGTAHDGDALFNARVVFDTGSTNLWVASVLCTQAPCDCPRAKEYYDPKKSLTAEDYRGLDAGDDIDIQFGTGELVGPLHTDSYIVGPMRVRQQTFAMIRTMTGDVFSSFPFEGILGLGFPSLSFGGIEPFFERVINQKLLEHNEFAFYFSVDSHKPSALLWGGVDSSLYEGSLRMFPVVQPHYWSLELVDFKVGGKSMMDYGNGRRLKHLVVDSGTTYFTAPRMLHDTISAHLPGAPCSDVEEYPDLTYTLRSTDGELFDLVVTQLTYMIGDEDSRCSPAFMELDVNEPYGPAVLLGEVFMRHFFTVFSRGDGDVKNAKIGFASANFSAPPPVSLVELSTLATSTSSGASAPSPASASAPAPASASAPVPSTLRLATITSSGASAAAPASLIRREKLP